MKDESNMKNHEQNVGVQEESNRFRQNETMPPAERIFLTQKDARRFLNDEGYRVSSGKLSQDIRKGLLLMEGDGCIRESRAVLYAQRHLRRKHKPSGRLDALLSEKAEIEVRHMQAKAARVEFDLAKEKRKWIRRRDFNREVAARAAVLDKGVQNFFRTRTADWVSAVGGDAKKVSMVLDLIMAEWNALLAEYASMERFNVIFEAESDVSG